MARSDYSSYGMTQEGYNSASSQFFVVTTDDKASLNSLNQYYASFGKVIEGYEFIEEIANLYSEDETSSGGDAAENDGTQTEENAENQTEENTENNTEENSESSADGDNGESEEDKNVPKMKSIRVETYGANYGLPNMINYDTTLSRVQQIQSYYQQLTSQSSNTETTTVDTAE